MSAAQGPAPIDGGPTEAFAFERASATPVAARPRGRTRSSAARPRPAAPPVDQPALRELQSWFHSIITHPADVVTALSDPDRRPPAWREPTTESLIACGTTLGASERLAVYHYAYRARLMECLADDFPAVRNALGCEAFTALCETVIQRRPSRAPNLNVYGLQLVEQCRESGGRSLQRFVRDLAELEWAMTEVFHAAAAPTLSLEALRAIPLERWTGASFTPSATVRVLSFSYPANAYLQAFRDERAPAIPRARRSSTAVYRQGFRIWRMDLTPAMADLLARLFAGVPLGDALEAVPAGTDGPQVMRWFTEWVSGGFFASIST